MLVNVRADKIGILKQTTKKWNNKYKNKFRGRKLHTSNWGHLFFPLSSCTLELLLFIYFKEENLCLQGTWIQIMFYLHLSACVCVCRPVPVQVQSCTALYKSSHQQCYIKSSHHVHIKPKLHKQTVLLLLTWFFISLLICATPTMADWA